MNGERIEEGGQEEVADVHDNVVDKEVNEVEEVMMVEEEARLWRRRFVAAAR